LKILATDGFNTNATVSNGTFTIVPPPHVSVESLSELYSNYSFKVFEGIVLNDGGQSLNETAWTLDTGLENVSSVENATLVMNERLFVIFEHNYSSGGEMNVTLFAHDDGQSVNDSLSLVVFVGDVRVTAQELYANSTRRVFAASISNDGTSLLDNVVWNASTGDANVTGVTAFNLSAGEDVILIFEHEYADSGEYLAEFAASDGFSGDEDAVSVTIPDVTIEQFLNASQEDETVVFIATIRNDLNDAMNVSWTLDTGDEVVTSAENTSLGSGERVFLIAATDYGAFGDFVAELNASDGSHTRQYWRAVSVRELAIENLAELSSNATIAVFTFTIENLFSTNRTFNWSFDPNESGVITATTPVTLVSDENITILVQHNFTSAGTYAVTASANTSLGNYTAALNASIS
jgi:hypothetical protein